MLTSVSVDTGENLGRQRRRMWPAGFFKMRRGGIFLPIWPLTWVVILLSRLMGRERGLKGMVRAGFRMMIVTTKVLQALEVALAVQ